METSEETGGSFPVDVNENAGRIAARKSFVALRDRDVLAGGGGGGGGPEAGKGHVDVTGTGRNVNTDGPVQPLPPPAAPELGKEVMLDLVAAEKCLPGRLSDRCVISGGCGDYSGLNGFSESPGQEERTMLGLARRGEGGGGGGGGGGPAGTTAVSCPAVLGDRVSAQAARQIRRHRAGESAAETPDSDDFAQGEEATGGALISDHIRPALPLPLGQLSCTGKHQANCTCTAASSVSDAKMPNGDITGPDGGVTRCDQMEVFSGRLAGQTLGFCDMDCKEVKVANGGYLHMGNTDSDYFPEDNRDLHCDRDAKEDLNGPESGLCARSCSSGVSVAECPGEDAPSAAELPQSLAPSAPAEGSPIPGLSAKLPSPCPSTFSNLTSDTEPSTREEEEEEEEEEGGFSDLSLPARPQTLRTNPNVAFSLSCDATPLSPDGEGGFYFADEGYEEDFRSSLEVGRRQSAPDKLPDLTGQQDNSDHKLMPKRFGIADFFTRSLFSRKSKEPKAPSHNATGWRLFGKAAGRENDAAKDPASSSQQEEPVKGSDAAACPQQRPLSAGRRKNLEFEPLSTTALILEDRPA